MNKPLVRIIGGAMLLLILIFIGIYVYDNHLNKQENLNNPSLISSYWSRGYFKIDPETILESLENGDTNVFTPLLEYPQDVEALANLSIYWTQEDFLKIASAVGQIVWDDPMDLKDWSVYSIDFDASCGDPSGFYSAGIT